VALGASRCMLAGSLRPARPALLEAAWGSGADIAFMGDEGRWLVLLQRDLTGWRSALPATATGDGSGALWRSCCGGGRARCLRAAARARSRHGA
jgi:hypothetical protein